jgi:hypothetical protein
LGRINKQSIHEMIMAEIRTAFRFSFLALDGSSAHTKKKRRKAEFGRCKPMA